MSRQGRVAPILAFLLLASCGSPAIPAARKDASELPPRRGLVPPTPEELDPPPAPRNEQAWSEIERLISEQKLEAACEKSKALREAAQASGDEEEWTRALLSEARLRGGLHGHERALGLLEQSPWPKGALWRIALQLYYAEALSTYAQAYAAEVAQRAQVESDEPSPLPISTRGDLFSEADRAHEEIWRIRESLGAVSVDRLGEHLVPNTYPREVRGTLRDAISYLRVGHLARAFLWRPEHAAGTPDLDFSRLLAGDPAGSAKLDLAAPDLHPMLKIGAVLDDLERWHETAGRKEARLEARLERARRLESVFTSQEERGAIVADLKKRLPDFRDVPWWAVGMNELAGIVERGQWQGDPDAVVEAHGLASAGAERFPDSVGGRLCRRRMEASEQSEFQVSAMLNDGPRQRTIEVRHRNLPALWMRAYRLDTGKEFEAVAGGQLRTSNEALRHALANQRPAHAWKVELPATPDLRLHRTFVTTPIDRTGVYLLAVSDRKDFSEEKGSIVGATLVLTNLVLLSRAEAAKLVVRVLDGKTGNAVAGVTVRLVDPPWSHRPSRHPQEAVSDAAGTVEFPGRADLGQHLVAEKDGDVTLAPSVPTSYQSPLEERPRTGTFLYTDRSVYRPGQKVLWKVVAFTGGGDLGAFETRADFPVSVELMDLNRQRIASQTVVTNGSGTAAGEFEIPEGRALGVWRLFANHGGQVKVRVEEYERPTFQVAIAPPGEPLRLNREASFTGEARYYFGQPLSSGAARWKVLRRLAGRQQPSPEEPVASGTCVLGTDGTFAFRIFPRADERLPGIEAGYAYTVSVDVTDPGGETRSASRTFRLGLTSVEAQVLTERGFLAPGAQTTLKIVRTGLNGAPRPGRGSWRLHSLAQPKATVMPGDLPEFPAPDPSRYSTPGDRMRSRSGFENQRQAHTPGKHEYDSAELLRRWPDATTLGSGELEHDRQGAASLPLPALGPGAYRLTYETLDDFGAKYELRHEFLVAGPQTRLALPAVLVAERSSVKPGEKAVFLAHSGIPGQPMLLEILRGSELVSAHPLRAGTTPSLIEIPIEARHRGVLDVRLTAVRDWQLATEQRKLEVPWDDTKLKIELATFRDRLRPGDREEWRVTVKGPDGKAPEAGSAELLAYMYDRSLDSFATHAPSGPLEWLRGLRHHPAYFYSSLVPQQGYGAHLGKPGQRASQAPELRGDALRNQPRHAIGGPGRRYARRNRHQLGNCCSYDDTMPAAAPGDDPVEGPLLLRSSFAETAFWLPQVSLDAEGAATLEFEVPDSVTAWAVWIHALSRDMKTGSLRLEARTAKELMVRPYLPRFVREGDEVSVQVLVDNTSDRRLDGTVDFELIDPQTGKSVRDRFGLGARDASRSFSAPAGGSTEVGFPVRIPNGVGQIAFRVVARSGDLSDGELRPLPILPSRVRLSQSRFAVLENAARRELHFADLERADPDDLVSESLVVTLDAQLFSGLLSALPHLAAAPGAATDSVLARYVSAGILSSLYAKAPSLAKRAEASSHLAPADADSRLAAEESPWSLAARRGGERGAAIPRAVVEAEFASARAALYEAQADGGGFPWRRGGPPSPMVTLRVAYGLAKAAEFGISVPRELVQGAWSYLAERYRGEYGGRLASLQQGLEYLVFLNYVASCYPDASWVGNALTAEERRELLDHAFANWKKLSPYSKCQLALTLGRAGRPEDARLVFDSVMDSARTSVDEGTFWVPEEHAWLWYRDTIQTHAFALRTLSELAPNDPRRAGLVRWLMLNKKLNHWGSSLGTAEVVYSLAHHLRSEKQLDVPERATVVLGTHFESFAFEPGELTGASGQLVVPGRELDPETMSTVRVSKETPGLMFASATWHFSTGELPVAGSGDLLRVSRTYYKRTSSQGRAVIRPLSEGAAVSPGDELEVHLSLEARHPCEFIHLRDPRAAGLEPAGVTSGFKEDLGLGYYEEIRDSSTNFFFERLPQGEYTFKYRLRAATAGTFKTGPATVQSMYAPEFVAYSTGATIKVLTDGK